MDHAVEETEASIVMCNLEAQHRYLTWRAEKVVLQCPIGLVPINKIN